MSWLGADRPVSTKLRCRVDTPWAHVSKRPSGTRRRPNGDGNRVRGHIARGEVGLAGGTAVTVPLRPRGLRVEQSGGADRVGRIGGVDDSADGVSVLVVDPPPAELHDGDGAASHRQCQFREGPP
ncbi:hypothetical protein BZB76_4191 [Actinomadura pelletieri DSM 43383]|uniref:Uncharacterized protein n=1 Tax=Actinomadura pelletieri DSM 43383 TaxID=1120940 RepID=A0A495QLY8_9ACTN|nr:hypothetical protein BZB76_4191 [Actinomadura pelletieri DSM 43383]